MSLHWGGRGPGHMGRKQVLAAAFTPLSLFGSGEKGAYYDISDTSTLFSDTAGTTPASVDGTVARVNDKSGNGYHLLQGTASLRPTLRQSGAVYYLEYDGTDDFMATATISPTFAHPVTGAVAARYSTGAGNFDRFIALWGGSGFSYNTASGFLALCRSGASFGPAHNSGSTPAYPALAADTDFVGISDLDATNMRVSKDGGAFASAAHGVTPALTITNIVLGAEQDGSDSLLGRVHAALVIDRLLTGAEATNLSTWLGAKQGRTI